MRTATEQGASLSSQRFPFASAYLSSFSGTCTLRSMAVPLTTTFTPPPQCTTDLWQETYDSDHFYALLGGQGYTTCLPASFIPTSEFFYSPGLYCPDGYYSACTSSQSVGSETATVVTCCPFGYSCQERANGPNAWPWEYTLGCTSACSSSYPITYTDSSSLKSDNCFVGGGSGAYSVQLRFREADLVTTTTALSSLASTSSSSTPLPSPSSISESPAETSAPSSVSSPSDSGLSTGAKTGIGVGAALGVALVAAILYLAWSIRRHSNNKSATDLGYDTGYGHMGYDYPELAPPPPNTYGPKSPGPTSSISPPMSMDPYPTNHPRHELR
ncbi:hypothetical protein BDV96DRAFT_641693 [Lophiotrema nucula]|uniref:Uncharacterized protein n=1 Tax=Lophiotrema nucula TaxID=690887 RepID=A0A6A5ZKK7_9PLEO|nr:hypothetical protein BDV96DRAFT_641693 [Lophiotrema nucula]